MTHVPESYYKELKKLFSESKEYEGYDADEDPGYFIEFLVRRIYESAQPVDEGPGREVSENHRYLRTLMAGLLAKDKGDFNLRDAGRELGELHHQMRERILLAERASVYLEWLKTLCGLILNRFPMSTEEAWARANLYAQAARSYLDGRHPPAECLDHPHMKDPRQEPAVTPTPPEGK